jgi:hypothetical protein
MIATRSSADRSAASSSARAVSVARTNRRDTAERDVARAVAATASPTGSRPADQRRHDTFANSFSIVNPSSRSVAQRCSHTGRLTSPVPSTRRARGRWTGTLRPPSTTDVGSLP